MNYPEFEKLTQVVKQLRHPKDGCPWDLEQTHQTLVKYLIEESFEFAHAAETNDTKAMEEELGDVLLQILLHTTIGEENKSYDLESVSRILREKLIRRHPHVFEKKDSNIDVSDVITNWEKIKAEEKENTDDPTSTKIKPDVLNFPALFAAWKIGKKTKKIKFDWDDASQVAYKVEEEWQELKEELVPYNGLNKERLEEEMGDFLFSAAQLARHLDIEPEEALRAANRKFLRRFHAMEKLIMGAGKDIDDMNQSEMDVYWDQAKINEKK